jgi:hypothetical protein
MINIAYRFSAPPVSALQIETLVKELHKIAQNETFFMVDHAVKVVGPDDIEQDRARFSSHFFRHLAPIERIGFDAWITNHHTFNISLFKYPHFQHKFVPWFCMQTVTLPNLPDDVYLARHLAVISVLDHVAKLGMPLQVTDDTDYWKHRSAYKMMEIKRALAGLTTHNDMVG